MKNNTPPVNGGKYLSGNISIISELDCLVSE